MEKNKAQEPHGSQVIKHGQGLRVLVQARHDELAMELRDIKDNPGEKADIEAALSALKALLTGDLDQIPPAVAQELSQWMDTSKYLGTKARRTRPI